MMLRSTLSLTLFALALGSASAFADADALAKIVDGKCVPSEQANGTPGPCAAVDVKGGFAILKDLAGATQFLLIATSPEPGIEATDLETTAPNYFEEAWEARHFMDDRLGRPVPRDDVGLAINSVAGRSQNRLHIHIDCVRVDVLKQLANDGAALSATGWTAVPGGLLGHSYRAMRIAAPELGDVNPFKLVADNLPTDDPKMGDETIVVVAAPMPDGAEGFYLLSDHVGATDGDRASGEELLDHDCAVLK